MKLLILTLCVAYAFADVSHIAKPEQTAEILAYENESGIQDFRYGFKTSNGISGEATGSQKNLAPDVVAQQIVGRNAWTDPTGENVAFEYTADENGYQAQGSHIPTPPPIPEAILRGLQYIRDHPPPPEK